MYKFQEILPYFPVQLSYLLIHIGVYQDATTRWIHHSHTKVSKKRDFTISNIHPTINLLQLHQEFFSEETVLVLHEACRQSKLI